METARCRAFMVSAEAGSFTRAAEQLNYTPSGVSQLVTAFENELGFALLRRTKRGVSLTESGKLIMPAVREFLAQEGRIEEIASEINGILAGSDKRFSAGLPRSTDKAHGRNMAGGNGLARRQNGRYSVRKPPGADAS